MHIEDKKLSGFEVAIKSKYKEADSSGVGVLL